VFIDGRYDTVPPKESSIQYLEFYQWPPKALTVLRAYQHGMVMLPRDSKAVEIMRQASEWRLIQSRQRLDAVGARRFRRRSDARNPIEEHATHAELFSVTADGRTQRPRYLAMALMAPGLVAWDRNRGLGPDDRHGFMGQHSLDVSDQSTASS